MFGMFGMFGRKNNLISAVLLVSIICLVYSLAVAQGLTPEQELGERLYFDENLSLNRNQSCASCHDPGFGFVDPDNVRNLTPVSDGSIVTLSGTRNAPSAAYAAFSPFFHWDGIEGLYVGGQFWDGRANTLAEQAAGPFINPVEMAMPNKWAVVSRLKEDHYYREAFNDVYGLDLNMILWFNPRIPFVPPGVLEIYDRMATAIGEFEKTREFNKFSSKFDYYLAGDPEAALSETEERGLQLFKNTDPGGGKCILCHPIDSTFAPDGTKIPPLFTDFTYDNLGIPKNHDIPGDPPTDFGLGGRPDIAEKDPDGLQRGKFKVMTLRNIEITLPYGHNGFFKTLKDIVHFYNTRDVPDAGWDPPEVPKNVNTEELGDLGLSDEDEDAIVEFLKTLTDGFKGPQHVTFPPFP
ncbi:MAG: cytochrome-c peroxidase [bacterium]